MAVASLIAKSAAVVVTALIVGTALSLVALREGGAMSPTVRAAYRCRRPDPDRNRRGILSVEIRKRRSHWRGRPRTRRGRRGAVAPRSFECQASRPSGGSLSRPLATVEQRAASKK
jgi:hypothetical protein